MKIFISYAHDDTARALAVKQSLDIHEVWFDQRLSIGQAWWDEIERQIATSHCFLLLLSPRSLQSEFCQKELALALKLNKPIAPVMVESMDIPDQLAPFQIIAVTDGFTPEATVKLLNGLFEIERIVFNPLKPTTAKRDPNTPTLAIQDLYFATTNAFKRAVYEKILNVTLQTASLDLQDIQHVDAGEVALHKAQQAYAILRKPVFVDHSGIAIRAWGGLPGGLTTSFIVPAGLANICKMLQPFDDKYAEAISVIAFSDGQIRRKFVGVVSGEIAAQPRGDGYDWHKIFIPTGFTKTIGEMTDDEALSISSRRRAIVEFMRFLQTNYTIS